MPADEAMASTDVVVQRGARFRTRSLWPAGAYP
jgi:hypothetical protein